MARTASFLGSLLLVTLLTTSALAQSSEPSEATREQARTLAAQGYEALQNGNFVAAEDLFRRADTLVHAPTIVVDHARALVGLGRLVEAHERYELVLREGMPANVPWSWQRAAADAERELALLKPRLAWLTVRVKGPSKPKVEVDDKDVPRAALGVRRATDPGVHTVKVRASGYLPTEREVTLGEGEPKELEVQLELDPNSVKRAELEEDRPEEVRARAAEKSTSGPSNALAYVLLGIGGAGIATGAVTGFMALGVRSDLDKECAHRTCKPTVESDAARYQKDIDRYRVLGTVSGVSFGAGVAAAAAGGVLLWLGGHEKAPEKAGFQAAPYLGAGELGMVGRF
jgi:ubiquitin